MKKHRLLPAGPAHVERFDVVVEQSSGAVEHQDVTSWTVQHHGVLILSWDDERVVLYGDGHWVRATITKKMVPNPLLKRPFGMGE